MSIAETAVKHSYRVVVESSAVVVVHAWAFIKHKVGLVQRFLCCCSQHVCYRAAFSRGLLRTRLQSRNWLINITWNNNYWLWTAHICFSWIFHHFGWIVYCFGDMFNCFLDYLGICWVIVAILSWYDMTKLFSFFIIILTFFFLCYICVYIFTIMLSIF